MDSWGRCWGKDYERDWNKGAETLANNIIQNHPEFKVIVVVAVVSSSDGSK